jgi:hypothetical protein
MEGIRATIGSRSLLFGINGNVIETAAGGETVRGKWLSTSNQQDNQLRYDIDGVKQPALQAVYSFNDDNQLVVVLQTPTGPVAPFTLLGGIEVDDQHDLIYNVIDPATGAATISITVYGELDFAAGTNNLRIKLAGGGEAQIKGDLGVQSLETTKNSIATAGFKADDILSFKARTRNSLTGGANATKLAKLKFIGNWDVSDGSIVFVSKITGVPAKPGVSIGFGGKFKAVSAGFVYFADGNSQTIALNIRGSHQRTIKGSSSKIDWETSIGFTEKTFQAEMKVTAAKNFPSGQALTIDGSLTLKKDAQATEFAMSLDVVYAFEQGSLVFKADIKNGIRPTYDLRLDGDFKYKNLKITFGLRVSNVAGSQEVAVSVGVEGNEASIVKHLSIIFNISQSEARARVSLNIEIEARLRFVNGKRITTEVKKAIPAGGGSN